MSDRSEAQSYEQGLALIEFAVCAPFLVLLLTAMIDVGGLLSQYVILSNALHAGLRTVANYPDIETNANFRGLTAGQLGCSSLGNSASHQEVQQIVEDLINQRRLWIEDDSLCILSGVRRGGVYAGTSDDNTAVITVSAKYDGFFPLIDGTSFQVSSTAPTL